MKTAQRTLFAATLLTIFSTSVMAQDVTIIYTNDLHAHVDSYKGVQHRRQGLETGELLPFSPGKDQPFAGPIAPTEGDGDPGAGQGRGQPLPGHQIVVRLINGIGRGADRDLHDDSGLHASVISSIL